MKISLEWINELINIENISNEFIINKLTLGGFEVEEILEVKVNDKKIIILDITATANRSDSLSIQGLTLEITALLNRSQISFSYLNNPYIWSKKINNLNKKISNNKYCSIFIAIIVKSLKVKTIPTWLNRKLTILGITPKNNLLDFRDYILLETGYPFEFYDFKKTLSKLKKSKFELYLRYGKQTEQFNLSINSYKNLTNSVLVINANELPISIAGIKTNYLTDYSNDSESLLIEGSIFNAYQIRKQSRLLGLRTDRSSRYEKSLKNITLLESLYKLVLLLRRLNPDLICKLHTFSQWPKYKKKQISIDMSNIKEILGPNYNSIYISPILVSLYFNRLKFIYEFNILICEWHVKIPYSRSDDILNAIDLIEEIGRLCGFNNFLIKLPDIQSIGLKDFPYQTRKKIISSFINLGFTESMHYSFINQKLSNKIQIEILNPLVNDYRYLRISLLPNLIKNTYDNIRQSNLFMESFECGHIFFNTNNSKYYLEKESIAGIFISRKEQLENSSNLFPWFKSKGRIEYFFNQLNITTYWKKNQTCKTSEIYNTLFHPYCTADVLSVEGTKIGIYGQIHPILANRFNFLKNLYLFEFHFESINNCLKKNKVAIYYEYSLYPKITKDLSFLISKNISFKEIKNLLYVNGTEFLVNIHLLDKYENSLISSRLNNLCLQLTFQSKYKTLTTKEVEPIISNLQFLLIDHFNITIRL